MDISFSAINYETRSYLKYYYRLLPSQKEFQEVGTGKFNLRGMPMGRHTLELKIENRHKEAFVKTIKFRIKPRIYEFWWFYPFLAFAAIVLAFFYFRHQKIARTNKDIFKLKKKEELTSFKLEALRSQMNPHFVFNSLNAIQYYINESEIELSEKYLVRFARLIRQYFNLSTEKEITLNKEVELLETYLSLEEMRFSSKLRYSITIDKQLNLRTNVIPTMLIQPIVENAVNHGVFHRAGDGEVNILFHFVNENSFKVIVQDNGVGIENAKEIKRKSLNRDVSKSSEIFKQRLSLLIESKTWEISHETKNMTSDSIFPGTVVTILIKRNKDDTSDTDR